jgi:hypothetical protein
LACEGHLPKESLRLAASGGKKIGQMALSEVTFLGDFSVE